MKRTIKAFIYPEDDGYVVECPDVRAFTQGDTLDEAIAHLREAVALEHRHQSGERFMSMSTLTFM